MLTVSAPTLDIVPTSRVDTPDAQWGLTRPGSRLVVFVRHGRTAILDDFDGEISSHTGGVLLVADVTPRNALALRRHVPWLRPQPVGLRTSVGMGDRLGLATPGHARAVQAVGGAIAPVFAQQSIREMTRTGRTARQVLDDATWGAFQEGWRGGVGADADHLKTTEDVDACLAAGFTTFTLDPGEYVDSGADTAGPADLAAAVAALPWEALEDREPDLRARYARPMWAGDHAISFDGDVLPRAAAKYGRAVAHVARLHRHLAAVADGDAFELEVSVDETDTPTSHAEHAYVATELRRLGVRWVSLAPRYVGRFEKGVDYIGDLAAFEADFAVHAAIARHFGPYKLSLHSGSDKFSIYPIVARHTRGLVHLKTAGTSYLEALRTVAVLRPPLFREIYGFARDRYEADRASYHVSATLDAAPAPAGIANSELPGLLDQFHAREILHVTFGSVLTDRLADETLRFADAILSLLRANPEAYAGHLQAHFARHLAPFTGSD